MAVHCTIQVLLAKISRFPCGKTRKDVHLSLCLRFMPALRLPVKVIGHEYKPGHIDNTPLAKFIFQRCANDTDAVL